MHRDRGEAERKEIGTETGTEIKERKTQKEAQREKKEGQRDKG